MAEQIAPAVARHILGKPVYRVNEPEELLWRIASWLDGPANAATRRNLRARIRKALDGGGDWREELSDEEVARYG